MIPEGAVPTDQRCHGRLCHEAGPAKVLVQDMNCIETLARVDVLCVDKTGTITEPGMEVQDLIPLDQQDTRSVWSQSRRLYSGTEPENDTGRAMAEMFA